MKPTIEIISRMKKDEIPRWLLYSHSPGPRNFYNLTINGKKCYLNWRDENQCMLYVDGLERPGLDVNNSIHDSLTSKRLFHVDLILLDSYINEAVKLFEQEQKYIEAGLSIDQAKTAIKI